MDKAKVRVDEDLPQHLRELRAKNRPVFRYLLEVRREPNVWYRMRGGKIQLNNTFTQGQDSQGAMMLVDRGTWRDFDAGAFAESVKAGSSTDIPTWWNERTARLTAQRTTQQAIPPTQQMAPQATQQASQQAPGERNVREA